MYARINGYWKEDRKPIAGYVVCIRNPKTPNPNDDSIFFYFEDEEELQTMVAEGAECGEDFVVTDYTIM